MKYFKNITSIFILTLCMLAMAGSGFYNSAPRQKQCSDVAVLTPKTVDVIQPPVVKKSPVKKIKEEVKKAKEEVKKIKEEAAIKITMSFVGDCLIATERGATGQVGSLNWTANRQPSTYFFNKAASIFSNDDFTVADCENVFTDSAFTPIKKYGTAFWFRSAKKNASIFKSGSVDIVSAANNHTGDYGREGFSDTVKSLESAGMKVGYSDTPVIVEKCGVRIGIICCEIWCYDHYRRTVSQMKKIESDTDIQIVYFHGGTEKIHQPEKWKINAAHKLVDAGADLVVGGHPHVLQPMEIYHNVPIVYSVGNFVYGGHQKPENRTIIYQASFAVKAGKISVLSNIIPYYVYTGKTNNWQPDKITNKTEKAKVLDFMNGHRELPY